MHLLRTVYLLRRRLHQKIPFTKGAGSCSKACRLQMELISIPSLDHTSKTTFVLSQPSPGIRQNDNLANLGQKDDQNNLFILEIYIYIHTHIYTHTHIILSVVTRNTLLIFDSYPICYHLLLYSLGFLSRELSDSSFPQPISTVGSFLFRAVDIRLLLCTNDLCTPRTESICSLSGMLPTSRALLSGSWYDNDFI